MKVYPLPVTGEVILANQSFKVDAPVISYRQFPFWDATKEYCFNTETSHASQCLPGPGGTQYPYGKLPKPYTKRYSTRPALRAYRGGPSVAAAQSAITQFVLHHDGCTSADMCWSVLQNERGLSCHFLVDNNGVIFQTIDLALMAYHAAEFNPRSIGVEFCNRGDAKKYPDTYANGKNGGSRDKVNCVINGYKYYAFQYTKAQIESFTRLARELRRILPNLPVEFPQKAPGEQAWETLPRAAAFSFRGYIGHYHLTGQKWDPGPFDFKAFCRSLRGQFSLPMYTVPSDKDPRDKAPAVPENLDELDSACAKLYAANEQRADGGFFPIGPWGEYRLWHGGVHIVGAAGSPLYSQFPGRVVAARMGTRTAAGSFNFVLLRHDLAFGERTVRFYALYMHLQDELAEATPVVPWMNGKGWQEWKAKGGRAGEVALLDEPVEGGDMVGRFGVAGPGALAKPQVHLEIFSGPNDQIFEKNKAWEYIDGSAGGRFCDIDEINSEIDTNKDGKLNRDELAAHYAAGERSKYLRAILHVSEWTAEPNWAEALRATPDFRGVPPAEIDEMVAEQITPGLWWDERVARHARLPSDGVVYHYHPIMFLRFLNKELIEAAASAPTQVEGKDAPDTITDDFHDVDGSSMRSDLEEGADPCDESLTLEDLVRGFESPECVE